MLKDMDISRQGGLDLLHYWERVPAKHVLYDVRSPQRIPQRCIDVHIQVE